MDERLKAALEEGARNGATEVFEIHDKYIQLVEAENARHNQELANLLEEYGDNEAQYNFAQSILGGIMKKLGKE